MRMRHEPRKMAESSYHVRRRVRVAGTVQGVGFRPWVYRLAVARRLAGYVLNDSRGVVIEIEEQRIVLTERLAREEERLAGAISQRSDLLLAPCLESLNRAIDESRAREGAKWSEDSAREVVAAAIPAIFDRAFADANERCEREWKAALSPHRRRAEELIASVRQLVQELFDVSSGDERRGVAWVKAEHPYWRTHKWRFVEPGSIPPSWIDRLLPERLRHARIRRRLMEQVEYLATRNLGDIQSVLLENLKRSVQEFRDGLLAASGRAIDAIRRATAAARQRREEGSSVVSAEVCRLNGRLAEIGVLQEHLKKSFGGHVAPAEPDEHDSTGTDAMGRAPFHRDGTPHR